MYNIINAPRLITAVLPTSSASSSIMSRRLLAPGRSIRRLLLPSVAFSATTFRADAKASCQGRDVFASKYAIGIGVTALGAGGLWVYYQRQGAAALRDGLESYEKGDLKVAAQCFQKAADLGNVEVSLGRVVTHHLDPLSSPPYFQRRSVGHRARHCAQ